MGYGFPSLSKEIDGVNLWEKCILKYFYIKMMDSNKKIIKFKIEYYVFTSSKLKKKKLTNKKLRDAYLRIC